MNFLKACMKNYIHTFKNTSFRGRLAMISSTLFMGGGFFTNHFIKAFYKMIYHLTMLYYFIEIGFSFIIGTDSFRTLNMRLYSLIILGVWIYFYSKNLKETLNLVNEDQYPKPEWMLQIKEILIQKKKAFQDYKTLYKVSSFKERFDLISPFIWMGLFQFKHKAYIKGLLIFSIQVFFVIYLMMFGIYDIIDFIALDTSHLPPEFIRPSTFNLVYGLLAFLIIIVFFFVYIRNIQTVTIHVKNKLYQIKPFLLELKELRDHKLYISLLTFPILGVLSFTVLPLVFMIVIAFTSYQGSGQYFTWNGFEVFRELIFISDNLYTLISVLEWTLIWAFFATFTNYFGGIFLASLINKKGVKGKKIWRTIFIITMATPQFVSLLIMNQMFAFNGPVNQFLLNQGFIDIGINFWGNQTNARILIIVINMWIGIPYLSRHRYW